MNTIFIHSTFKCSTHYKNIPDSCLTFTRVSDSLETDSEVELHLVGRLGELLEDTLARNGGGRTGHRENVTCYMFAAEVSADPTVSSRAGKVLQSFLELR